MEKINFWYQRAVPLKIQKIIGKTNISQRFFKKKYKKISTFLLFKDQSCKHILEHKKMFHYVTKQNYNIQGFLQKKLT